MILVDTGPLVALFDKSDGAHNIVSARFRSLSGPFLSTLPALTEASHILGPASRAFRSLAEFFVEGACALHLPDESEIDRAFALMADYADLPMDFADASIVSAAESLNITKVFTLDARDFAVYRAKRGKRRVALTIV